MTQPDSEKLHAALAWFHKAELDLRAAENDLRANAPLTGSSAFHSQQAVEKAIKGVLFWKDRPFRKTHSIRELSLELADASAELAKLLEEASDLTPYATIFRYPGEEVEPTLDEANAAMNLAAKVVTALKAILPPKR